MDKLTLENGADILLRNVGNQLLSYATNIPESEDLNYTAAEARNLAYRNTLPQSLVEKQKLEWKPQP